MSKYHSKKVIVDGIEFDSKKEANRYCELSLMERAGTITDLERQVKYVLLPAQYAPVFDVKTKKWKDKCIERECSYYADFVYKENGKRIVEDTKGFRTPEYKIKRKLMYYIHGIQIKEV